MLPSHRKILDALRQRALSPKQLADATNLSEDGVRGRVSEIIHRFDYNIKKIDGKYQLLEKKDYAQAIIDYIDQYNLEGKILSFDELSLRLKIPQEQVTEGILQLFKRENITVFQMSKNSVKITKRW